VTPDRRVPQPERRETGHADQIRLIELEIAALEAAVALARIELAQEEREREPLEMNVPVPVGAHR
jgi:hypothetical protein